VVSGTVCSICDVNFKKNADGLCDFQMNTILQIVDGLYLDYDPAFADFSVKTSATSPLLAGRFLHVGNLEADKYISSEVEEFFLKEGASNTVSYIGILDYFISPSFWNFELVPETTDHFYIKSKDTGNYLTSWTTTGAAASKITVIRTFV